MTWVRDHLHDISGDTRDVARAVRAADAIDELSSFVGPDLALAMVMIELAARKFESGNSE
jgi:hypothetical protein